MSNHVGHIHLCVHFPFRDVCLHILPPNFLISNFLILFLPILWPFSLTIRHIDTDLYLWPNLFSMQNEQRGTKLKVFLTGQVLLDLFPSGCPGRKLQCYNYLFLGGSSTSHRSMFKEFKYNKCISHLFIGNPSWGNKCYQEREDNVVIVGVRRIWATYLCNLLVPLGPLKPIITWW